MYHNLAHAPTRQQTDCSSTVSEAYPVLVENRNSGNVVMAEVVGSQEANFSLCLENGLNCTALKADGCLLQPENGDRVLAFLPTDGTGYILQILHKKSPDWNLQCTGDIELAAPQGKCSLKSQDLRFEGLRTKMNFLFLELSGKKLDFKVLKADFISKKLSLLTDFCSTTVNRLLRRTGLEVYKADQVHMTVDGAHRTRAGQVSVVAEKDVRIDGQHINLG